MKYTPINIQQSVARYLADKLIEKDWSVFWWDTKQTEGVGDITATIVRKFPPEANSFIRQGASQTPPSAVRVPAFTVYVEGPSTTEDRRAGIGESSFFWNSNVGIEAMADNELQWFEIRGWFREWFNNPDVRVPVFDYQEDLTNVTPEQLPEYIQFLQTDLAAQELDEQPAARFYINCLATAEFLE